MELRFICINRTTLFWAWLRVRVSTEGVTLLELLLAIARTGYNISLDKHWHVTHIIASIFDWLFKYVRRSLSFTIILQKLTAGTLLNQERFGTEQEMEQLEKNEPGMNDLAEGPCFFRINIKRFQINRNMPSPNYVLTLDFVSYNLISCYFLNFLFCTL